MNITFQVTVIDQWPKLKLMINNNGQVREVHPVQYDIAASQFEPAVKDALQKAVAQIIEPRKRS
jgi:hypothetical protein